MNTGWQLVEGFLALIGSIFVSWWIFVAPSRGKRERQRMAREMKDPRIP